MHNCWSAVLTISRAKSAIYMSGINIVGFMCDEEGTKDHLLANASKDAYGLVGIIVCYRIFIVCFSIIAVAIFELFRKGVQFSWTIERQFAMDELKRRITEASVLVILDFSLSALLIILHIDASSIIGWGAILSQLQVNDLKTAFDLMLSANTMS